MTTPPIAEMVPKETPEAPYSHHWVGPLDGDAEPWIWVKIARVWIRGDQKFTPAEMHARGWVYGAICNPPEAIAELRRRLAAGEVGRGDVVPFTPTGDTP